MHILMLLTQSLDSPGGSGRFLPIARALRARGHDVTILALHHNIAELNERTNTIDGIHVRYISQMHVKKVGNTKAYFTTRQLLWIVLMATVKLTWWAMRTPCDVIQICKPQPMNIVAGIVASRLKRKPLFLDSDDWEQGSNQFGGKWQTKVVAFFENGVRHWVDGISAGTTFIADQYKRIGYPESKLVMLPNGVDRSRFTPPSAETIAQLRTQYNLHTHTPTILFIGSLSMAHAVDLLIDAFTQLVQELIPVARLLIVGGGENYDALKAQVEANRLGDSVTFVGRIPADQIAPYYYLADVTVDPREQSIEAESSLSLKLLESIACGIPVITTGTSDRADAAGGRGRHHPTRRPHRTFERYP